MDEVPSEPHAEHCPPRMMQEGESAKAYAAFQAYVEMGDARSLPEMVKNWDGSKNSLYLWAKKFRWHERIDAANAEVAAIYRRATERRAEIVAARIARQRIEIADSQFKLIELAHAKAREVLENIVVAETTTSEDGKTIIIKSNPNVRLTDAVRLLIGGNTAMIQVDQLLSPRRPSRSTDGSPVPFAESMRDVPAVEIWLDGGDGQPMPLSQIPEPDKLDPEFDPMADEANELPVR